MKGLLVMIGGVLALAGAAAFAEAPEQVVAPMRAIAQGEPLSADDFTLLPASSRLPADVVTQLSELTDMEARRDLAAGRAVLRRAITPVRVVRRNQPVSLVFQSGGVRVVVDGLALSDAAAGERVRVANARTRKVVTGVAAEAGHVEVRR